MGAANRGASGASYASNYAPTKMTPEFSGRSRRAKLSRLRLPAALTAVAALCAAVPALGYEFDLTDEISGSIITSLSTGFQMRVADRDPRNVGLYNGGTMHASSTDDGNLNFDKYDLISQISTVSTELSLKWRDFFLYARGTAFYDSVADNNDLAANGPEERPYRGRLNPSAHDAARYDAEMLDYLVGYNYQIGDRYGVIKVGNQVLNWGEALFTIGGISVINPINVSKIRVPGAELRDALIPVPMISNSIDLFSGVSLEAFYQWGFKPFKLEACGSYFSFTDALCDGAEGISVLTDYGDSRAFNAGTGQNPMAYDQPSYAGGPELFSVNMRLQDDEPSSVNDWGVALRALVPELNNTEFQLYFMRYTSRLPSLKAVVPRNARSTGGVAAGQLSGTEVVTNAPNLIGGVLSGLGVDQLNGVLSSLNNLLGTQVTDIVAALADPLAQPLVDALIDNGAGGAYGTYPRSIVLENLDNTVIHKYYASGINMIGFAFNTLEEWTGVAINFEVSYKHDVPVFTSETNFIVDTYDAAGGVPIDPVTNAPITALGMPARNPGIAPIVTTPGTDVPSTSGNGPSTVYLDRKHDMWLGSMRFTKLFASTDPLTTVLGASSVTALVEFGALYFDLKDNLKYASSGQFGYTGFGTAPLNIGGLTVVPPLMATDLPDYGDYGFFFPETGKAPTRWSGGVQGLIFWDYPDILTGVTLTPAIGFSSGLFGITPSPYPGFTKGVNSVNLQLKAEYLSNTSVILNYYKSWGGGGGEGGSRNPYIDRDFVGLTFNYQF